MHLHVKNMQQHWWVPNAQQSQQTWKSHRCSHSYNIALVAPVTLAPVTLKSEILDSLDKVLIKKMLGVWKCHQSGTSKRSEHAIQLDPKFTMQDGTNPDEKKKSTDSRMKELAHHTQIAQDLHSDALKLQMACEIHWQTVAKEIAWLVLEKGELKMALAVYDY